MTTHQVPRTLTHNQKKAAEAAFAGRPFDPSWSDAARAVYDGILAAKGTSAPPPEPSAAEGITDQEAPSQPAPAGSPAPTTPSEEPTAIESQPPDSGHPLLISREEAIKVGALIDVTPIAHTMGLLLPVGVSRPLWEIGITASRNVPEEQHDSRVRDVLLAFRLRLAGARLAGPVIEFPALLSFPPDPVPQACALFAVLQGDSSSALSVTFLLPGEVATGFLPSTNN